MDAFRKVKSSVHEGKQLCERYKLSETDLETNAKKLLDSVMKTISEYLLVRALLSKDPPGECRHQLGKMAQQKIGKICNALLQAANSAVTGAGIPAPGATV